MAGNIKSNGWTIDLDDYDDIVVGQFDGEGEDCISIAQNGETIVLPLGEAHLLLQAIHRVVDAAA